MLLACQSHYSFVKGMDYGTLLRGSGLETINEGRLYYGFSTSKHQRHSSYRYAGRPYPAVAYRRASLNGWIRAHRTYSGRGSYMLALLLWSRTLQAPRFVGFIHNLHPSTEAHIHSLNIIPIRNTQDQWPKDVEHANRLGGSTIQSSLIYTAGDLGHGSSPRTHRMLSCRR